MTKKKEQKGEKKMEEKKCKDSKQYIVRSEKMKN